MDDNRMPLPADLEAYESALEEREVAEPDPPFTEHSLFLPSLADAQRAAARVKYLRGKAAELEGVYASEEAVLLHQLEVVRQRRADAAKPFERRAGWYLFALEQFHRERLTVDPKEKTIKLPAGDMSMRAQQPEWVYGEDLVERLKEIGRLWFIRTEEKPDKAGLKKAVTLKDGQAVLIDDESGEVFELPITVQERDPKFEFKPA